jgi:hypothetical protein
MARSGSASPAGTPKPASRRITPEFIPFSMHFSANDEHIWDTMPHKKLFIPSILSLNCIM